MLDLEQQEDDRENPHAECEREIEARIAERDAALAKLLTMQAQLDLQIERAAEKSWRQR